MKIRDAIYQKILLRSVMCVFLLSLMLVTIVTGCAKKTDGCSISITAPSDANGPVTPGHSFFISGTIDGGEVLPKNTTLRVSVFNEAGEELRFAECSEMNRNVLDRFCSALFYYADDVDPEREDINAWNFPCLIVEDPEKPEQSLRNANIKCWFSEKEFNAFIPYATDVSRGLLIDDGIGYTNAAGIP